MTTVNVHDYVLFAVNTGEFYAQHCSMARASIRDFNPGGATRIHGRWADHVREHVVKRYRREVNKYARITYDDMHEVAAQLRTYYETHVKEIDACSTVAG